MTTFKNAFISYGRADSQAFAAKISQRLMAVGLTAWFDFDDIPFGVDYQKQVDDGIEKADNVLFIISPHSVNSPYCALEIELALKRGKRIIPLLHVEEISRETWQQRNPGGTDEQWQAYRSAGKHSSFPNMHPAISKINWVYFREGLDDFETAFQGLVDIFGRQQDYVRRHTELLAAALTWEQNQKRTQFLLTGQARQQAEAWLQVRFQAEQPPCVATDLHCEFITESIKNAHNLMTQVFLAHAETDAEVMAQIRRVLQRQGITVWTSAIDIRSGEDFRQAIRRGIEQADNLVYLLSPAAIASEFCQQELDYALSLNKRIIPVLVSDTDAALIPAALQNLQYIEWRAVDSADRSIIDVGGATPEEYRPLLKVLKDDAAYFNEHKVLLTQALKWERQQRNPSILLRGYNLRHAEAWLKLAQMRSRHQPTPLQTEFLQASLRQPPAQSLDVFISYSRVDADFARQLNDRLQMQGKRTWFDQESIASGSDFQQEIYRGIETSDHFLFILSPEAVNSPYCADEVEYAQTLNKRVVTVLHRPIDISDLHPVLAAVQWIDFRQQDGDFNANFKELLRTLECDRNHLEAHTRLLLRALEWDKKQRRSDLLLRGDEFVIAENWLVEAFEQQKQPLPTPLQKDYIQSGREAQEREVKREKRRILVLRSLLVVMSLAFLGAAGAGVYAYRLWRSGEIAQIESLAKQSNAEFLAGRNTDALITALEAGHRWEKYPESNRALVQKVLAQAVNGIREIKSLDGHDRVVDELAVSPDGETIASATRSGTIRLWSKEGELLHSFLGHKERIGNLVFSPDGQLLASASVDKTAKLWNLQGELLHTLTDHSDQVWNIDFSLDGQTIVTASSDGVIKFWDRDGNLLKTLKGHENELYRVVFSPDGEVFTSHSEDQTIKLWNLEGELLHTLVGHTGGTWTPAFSPDGQFLAAGGDEEDPTVRIWSRQGELLHTLPGHEDRVRMVAFSPDGQTLASASRDKTIRLWTLEGQPIATLIGHSDEVMWIGFSSDGQTLVSASVDNTIKHWNLDGTLIQTLTGHQAWIGRLAFNPHDQTFASSSGDFTVKLWQLEGTVSNTLQNHSYPVRRIRYSPDGQSLVTGSTGGNLKFWMPDGTLIKAIEAHDDEVESLAFSPDGRWLASISEDEIVKVWSADGELLYTLEHPGGVNGFEGFAVRFSPDGNIIASASGNTVKLWSTEGVLLHTLSGHSDKVPSVSFSPDGKTLATASNDGTVKLWTLEGELLHTLGNQEEPYGEVTFSPDGQHLIAGNGDGTLQLWNANGNLLHTLEGHTDEVNRVLFNADGETIISVSDDGTAKLWNLAGELLHTLKGHKGQVWRIALSPDGEIVATGGEDFTVRLWSMNSGELLQTLVGHHAWIFDLSFSPDGKTLASSSADKTAILWDLEALEFDALMQRGCEWWREYTEHQAPPPVQQRAICDAASS